MALLPEFREHFKVTKRLKKIKWNDQGDATYLESTASSKPVWEKTTKADRDRASYHCPWCSKKWPKKRRSGPSSSNDNENPDIAAIIAQQLQTILPEIVTQVTNNVNNANNGNRGNGGGGNGNGGNNGCTTSKAFQSCNPMEYVWKGVQIARTVGSEKNGKCDR
ncbi:hypothetical protein Tco_0876071 [Tanacetum coccineum]|uniref:Uncharacterized protein n=1 Tax=Tanacetum coccineum TaxID=301880 RepID=A0ABQ5BR90_9ASTR